MQPERAYSRPVRNEDELQALIGKSLGQFRIVERIGIGGMAAVFKAYQPTLDRYVAVKVLPSYYARDPVFVKRFVQEARSVAKLAHPNIVQIHDFGEQDEITYIVMEYVDGGTLKDRLKQALPVQEAADFIIQAAEGLDCAHRNGIVHRDVKPANMLLRRDGHLLLSDFGIAKILEGAMNLTRVGTGIGTPQYMSPEQGTGLAVDRRSDIYSLGVVFFHCLTGRVPFSSENPLTITMKHLQEPIPADWLRAARVPDPVVEVVLRMTAKQPHDRYQSMEAVIVAITDGLAASNIALPHPWRVGPVQSPSSGGNWIGRTNTTNDQANVSKPLAQPSGSFVRQSGTQQPLSTRTCFRCGSHNPSTRLYCTFCGYDLSNKQVEHDQYLGLDGRPMLARLIFQSGSMNGRSYRFHQDTTTIGRTNGNDLVISGMTVSRRHARLWFDNGRWFLEDLGSANGTLVNNVRITRPVALNDGDVINFGDEIVVFTVT